jgi:hypothetical protein
LNIQPNLTPKIQKIGYSTHVQCEKSKKVGFLDFCWIFGLFVGFLLDYWIGLEFFSSIQSNNPKKTQLFRIFDIERGLNIQLLMIFGVGFGWMFNNPSNPKSRKKFTS